MAVAFSRENWKYKINLHRVWVEIFYTSPIFLRKKKNSPIHIPPVSSGFKLWPRAHPTSLLHSLLVGVLISRLCKPQSGWWINIVLSVAPHTLWRQWSASKFAELSSPVLWTILVGPHCRGEGWDNGASLTSPSTRSSVSSCTNSTGNGFYSLRVIFCLLKLCKPGKHNNCFVKSPKRLTIHFPNKEPAVPLMLRMVNPKCGELIK